MKNFRCLSHLAVLLTIALYGTGNLLTAQPRPCVTCTPVDAVLGDITTVPCGGEIIETPGNGGKWTGEFLGYAGEVYHWDLCPDGVCGGFADFMGGDPDIAIFDAACNLVSWEDGPDWCGYAPDDWQWTCSATGIYYVWIEPWGAGMPPRCGGDSSMVFYLAYHREGLVSAGPTGRCCYNSGNSCSDITEFACVSMGGAWDSTLVCADCACNLVPPSDSLWMQVFGTEGNEVIQQGWAPEFGQCDVAVTRSGGFISVTNSYVSEIDDHNIFVVKCDSSGRTEWQRSLGTANIDEWCMAVDTTLDGGFILGAVIQWPRCTVVKLDAQGDSVWSRNLGFPGNYMLVHDIRSLADGGFAIAGRNITLNKPFAGKMDAFGNVIWARNYTVPLTEQFGGVCESGNGDLIFAGWGYTNEVHNRIGVVATNANGDTLWTRIYGGTDTRGQRVSRLSDGDYIITGHSFGRNYYAMKLSQAGDSLWTHSQSGRSYGIAATQDGGAVIAGHDNISGSEQVKVVKIDANGLQEWMRSFGGAAADAGRAVQQRYDGSYIVAGYSESFCNRGRDLLLIRFGQSAPPPPVYGRCCYDNGANCTDNTFEQCLAFGGIWDSTATCALTPCSPAPDSCWSSLYGGAAMPDDYDWLRDVIQLSDCGFLSAGWNFSESGNEQGWLIKTDVNTTTVLDRKYGGAGSDRFYQSVELAGGDFVVVGRTGSYGVAGSQDGWLLRCNSVGDTIWTRTYGTAADDRLYSMAAVSTGGYVLAGTSSTNGSNGSNDYWLVRVDAEGNELWQRRFGGVQYDLCWEVVETADGDFALGGYTESFGSGSRDWWILRTNSDGDSLWSSVYGGPDFDWCGSLVALPDSGLICAGSIVIDGTRGADATALRINKTGQLIWQVSVPRLNTQEIQNLIRTNDGDVIGVGTSWDGGQMQFFLAKFGIDSDVRWVNATGNVTHDEGYGVVETDDGSIVACGMNIQWNGTSWVYSGSLVQYGECTAEAPAEPQVVISTIESDVLIQWNAVDTSYSGCSIAAPLYEVYVSPQADESFSLLASTPDTFFIETGAVAAHEARYYYIRALSATLTSAISSLVAPVDQVMTPKEKRLGAER